MKYKDGVYQGYDPTVGEIIEVLKKFDKDSHVWFEAFKDGKRVMLNPVGTAGNYSNQRKVIIQEGSYQNTISFYITDKN